MAGISYNESSHLSLVNIKAFNRIAKTFLSS